MRKSLRFQVRFILAFISKFKLIFLVGIVIGLFVFFGLTFILRNSQKKVSATAIIGEYTPDNLPNSVTNLISSGLTALDENGNPVPAVAQNWEITDSGRTWTFFLNRSLRWQDGSEIVSRDINYNFSDATTVKPDKYTIVYKLKTPLAPFAVTVARPLFKKGLLGNGAWKVTNLSLAGSYVNTLTLENKKGIKILKFYPTVDRAKLAFELGEVQEITDLTNSDPFTDWKTVNLTPSVNKQRYVAVFFNNLDSLLADKDFRQALSYGIDKSTWTENRAYGPISPKSWAYNPSLKPYDFDINHALDLITQSKIDPNVKNDLKIKLTTSPDLLPIANNIAKNWEKIGIKTIIQVTEFIPDDYQAFLAVYNIPDDPDQYLTWHSTQRDTNLTHYKSPRIDKLLEDGRLETDTAKRKQIYFDFQKFLVEDSPAAFLYYPTYYTVSRK